MENNKKCVFGECKAEENFDCKKCGETTKEKGFTGCIYAKYKPCYNN